MQRTGIAFRGFDEAGQGALEQATQFSAAQAISTLLDEPYPANRFTTEVFGREKSGQAGLARSKIEVSYFESLLLRISHTVSPLLPENRTDLGVGSYAQLPRKFFNCHFTPAQASHTTLFCRII